MNKIKYPRTFHMPNSPGKSKDDNVLSSLEHFYNKEIVASIKMDGENTTCYNDYIHARSLDSTDHISQHWMKSFHANWSYLIPKNWRICGENLYAKHSIHYFNLDAFFQIYSIWNEYNICLNWKDTIHWANNVLNIPTVKVLYQGTFKQNIIDELTNIKYDENGDTVEGIVIRLSDEFHYNDFHKSVAKWVRANHVQTDQHWKHSKIILNKIKDL